MKTSHPEAVAANRVNPGETLRKAREHKSLSLADVAAQLNLTPLALQQLEAGAFEKLPGNTFSRGYVRAYAKLLGMDQNRLVSEFDQFTGSDSSGSSVHSLGRIEEPVRLSQSILKLVSLALLLVLGAGAFFWWQAGASKMVTLPNELGLEHVEVEGADGTTEIHALDEPEDQAVVAAQTALETTVPTLSGEVPEQAPATVAEGAAEAVPPALAPAGEPVAPAAPAQPVEQPQTPPAPAPAPATPEQPAPIVPPVLVPEVPTAEQPAIVQAPVAGESRVHLQFTADCWTQLTDANGKVLLSALKRRGESVELIGKAPLELRLGFARGAQVRLDGQPVDVAAFTHGETARLKLGQ